MEGGRDVNDERGDEGEEDKMEGGRKNENEREGGKKGRGREVERKE